MLSLPLPRCNVISIVIPTLQGCQRILSQSTGYLASISDDAIGHVFCLLSLVSPRAASRIFLLWLLLARLDVDLRVNWKLSSVANLH